MPGPIYVVGHKHSDLDSVASAYGYARLLQLQGGAQQVAARQVTLKPEVRFVLERFHVDPPQELEDMYLWVCDVMQRQVLSISLDQPLLEAGLLNDTLILHSPTCTPRDKRIAEELAALAGEDLEPFGLAIFAVAAAELGERPIEALLMADCKEFPVQGSLFAIGTVETTSPATIEPRIPQLLSAMQRLAHERGYSVFLFLLVDILQLRSRVLIRGGGRAVAGVLGVPLEADGHSVLVEGLVSRKKQVVARL